MDPWLHSVSKNAIQILFLLKVNNCYQFKQDIRYHVQDTHFKSIGLMLETEFKKYLKVQIETINIK